MVDEFFGKVVNIKNTKEYDVYIGRAGRGQDGYFGNPFTIGKDGTREEVIALHAQHALGRIRRDPEFAARVAALEGKTLGCFCAPEACHGEALLVLGHFQNLGILHALNLKSFYAPHKKA